MPVPQKITLDTRIVSLPCAMRETAEGVILRRGRTTIEVGGGDAAAIVGALLRLTSAEPVRLRDILEGFAEPERPAIKDFLQELLQRRLMVPATEMDAAMGAETPEGLFFWQFDLDSRAAGARLADYRVDLVGINAVSLRLLPALVSLGVRPRQVIDHPLLRDPDLFDGAGRPVGLPADLEVRRSDRLSLVPATPDMVIVAAIGTAWSALRSMNEECVHHRVPLLPVLLQGMVGRVGPIVVPHETACLECARARENSNLGDMAAVRRAEFETDLAAQTEGYLRPMAGILGDVAAMELARFILRIPKMRVGSQVEVNLLTSRMEPRPVLKVPRCRVCSSATEHATTAIKENIFLLD